MKFLINLYYFSRSLLLRGPLNSFRLFLDESAYEKKFNIKSTGFIRSKSREFFHYQGAAYRVLLRILKEEEKNTKTFKFVDIGSGMGRAVFAAEYCGYSNLTGIELNKELVDISNHNLKTYAFKKHTSSIQFVNENALEHNYCDEPCVYFLFNPFNAQVLKKVIQRIKENTRAETLFIYMNPLYSDVFDSMQVKKVKTYKTGFYVEAVIYKLPSN